MTMTDDKERFHWQPPPGGTFHIFTDGSCEHPNVPALRLASWAVCLMEHNLVLASGFLPGLSQSIDLAELHAVLSALLWALRMNVAVVIHTDSSYVVDGLSVLRRLHAVPVKWRHQQRWSEVLAVVRQLDPAQRSLHQVYSHQELADASSPLVEWWIRGNAIADAAASMVFECGDPQIIATYNALCEHHQTVAQQVVTQLSFLVDIAQTELATRGQNNCSSEDVPISLLHVSYFENSHDLFHQISLEDSYSLDSQPLNGFTVQFCDAIVQFLLQLDLAPRARYVTGIELLFGFIHFSGMNIPWPRNIQGEVAFEDLQQLRAGGLMRHTCASALRIFKRAVRTIMTVHDAHISSESRSRPDVFLMVPQWALLLGWPHDVEQVVSGQLKLFFSARPHRRACDLARPLP